VTKITRLALAIVALSAASPSRALAPGEEIRMDISWLHLPTGSATISIGQPDGAAWPLVYQGKTGGLVSLLEVREKYVTWWDPEGQLPWGSNLSAVELGDRHDDEVRFDRGALKATIKVERKGKVRTREVEVPADALDLPSVMMFLRLQALTPGQRFAIPCLAGKDLFRLEAEVMGTEKLDTEIGALDAVAVRVKTAFKGKFDAKRDSWLWFSNDARHVPLKISAEFTVGSLVAEITGYRPGTAVAAR
jgi:hypothetical protein